MSKVFYKSVPRVSKNRHPLLTVDDACFHVCVCVCVHVCEETEGTRFACHAVRAGNFLDVLDLREPKIADLQVSVLVQQQVCRLEVAVDNDGIAVVQEAQRPR